MLTINDRAEKPYLYIGCSEQRLCYDVNKWGQRNNEDNTVALLTIV